MSLPHALLGLINYRAATGYELKQTFSKSIHFFWDATLPQIYRTLNDMEAKAWLSSTFKHQEGKPSRKVYRVTQAGVKELKRWLAAPTEPPEPRLAVLVKTFFGNQLEPRLLAEVLKQWCDYHRKLLKTYEEKVVPVIARKAELMGADNDARYWGFTLDYGRRYAKMNIEWCEATMEALRRKVSSRGQPSRKTGARR
ncbi:MAG TPA: PadR family transcriptional regulator [Syntrophorhabdales bacterium]|nr:PadR family transcriptional regulator [Syntrophorhabdales bacterium]